MSNFSLDCYILLINCLRTLSRTNSSLEDQSTGSGTSKHERKKINWTPVPKDDTEGQAPKAIEVVLKPGQKVKDLKHLFEHH